MDQYARMASVSIIEVNNSIWFSSIDRNGLCEVDIDTKEIKNIYFFEKEEIAQKYITTQLLNFERKIFCIPSFSDYIYIFDLDTKKFELIDLNYIIEKYENKNTNLSKFAEGFIYGEFLYLTGCRYPIIMKINLKNYEVSYIENSIKNTNENNTIGFFISGSILIDDKALIPIGNSKTLLELQLNNDESKIISVDVPFEYICDMSTNDGVNIWICGRGKLSENIVSWNRNNNTIKKYFTAKVSVEEILRRPFNKPIITDSKVYIFPLLAEHIYEIDLKNDEVSVSDELDEEIQNNEINKLPRRVIFAKIEGETLRFLNGRTFRWYEYSLTDMKLNKFFISIKDQVVLKNYYDEIVSSEIQNSEVVLEERVPLEKFIKCKILKKHREDDNNQLDSELNVNFGKKIYNAVCKNQW